jgi:hypothetical protein
MQNPDIAITGNGHVYVTFGEVRETGKPINAVVYAKSSDCGRSFAPPATLQTFLRYRPLDVSDPQPIPIPASSVDDPFVENDNLAAGSFTRECGDFSLHCVSGFTFFRVDAIGTQVRSSADQFDSAHEYVYIVYDATKPSTQVSTGTSYFTVAPGIGSQSGVFFTRLDGARGMNTTPVLIDDEPIGHQIYPAISADGGVVHAIWWDSRLDPNYSPARPIGNDANRATGPALDAWAAVSTDHGDTWGRHTRLSTVSSNPNYEQFSNRTVPFAGDYLWSLRWGLSPSELGQTGATRLRALTHAKPLAMTPMTPTWSSAVRSTSPPEHGVGIHARTMAGSTRTYLEVPRRRDLG